MSRAPKTSPKNIPGRSEEEIRQKISDDVRLKKENFDDLRLRKKVNVILQWNIKK